MISVVIPAWNEEKLLPRCLASLKQQDFGGQYEIIVSDNDSTDGTAQIAHSFGARVVSCPRRGVTFARQTGAEAAIGELIVQADADTVYPRDWLSRIDRHFASHPRSAALAGRYIYEKPPWWAPFEMILRLVVNLSGLLFLGNAVFISGANFSFRSDYFGFAGGYSTTSLYPDQWGIAHRLSRFGKIYYDHRLVVTTSPRRVTIPLPRVLFTGLLNLMRILAHFGRHNASQLKKVSLRNTFTHTSARFSVILVMTALIAVIAYGYFIPSSQVFGRVYYKAATSEKVVALTFDDGPNEPYTSSILDILQSRGVKASFFVVANNVVLYPDVAKRIINDGHMLANHSETHRANHALSDFGNNDIIQAQENIARITGIIPHFYRPPHGKKSPWELEYLKKEGLVEVTWSAAVNDQHEFLRYGKPTPQNFAHEIVSEVKRGGIVLMHDGFGLEHNTTHADKSLTVSALPLIIDELQYQGFRFVTIAELFNVPAYN